MTAPALAAPAVPLDDLDLTRVVRPGDTVLWTPGVGEPLPVIERLLAQRHRIGPFTVLYAGAGYTDLVRPEHADTITFRTAGAVGSNRALCDAGVAEILTCHLSELSRLLARGTLRPDVVIASLSEDARGVLSHGAASSCVDAALPGARTVLAEINDRAPWTHARRPVDPTRIDLVVRTSRPLPEVVARPPSPVEQRIAAHVVDLVPDGATVQLGIGGVPNAVAGLLRARRRLGLHCGVVGDAVIDLITCGAVTNEHKPTDRGVSVTGALVGTRALLDFADREPLLRVEPVSHTHDHATLRGLPAFTAVNSALEVDLTGQVGAEVAGSAYVGTTGGQVDFVRGALAAPDGRSIIALPARTAAGRARVVSRIASGVVTTGRADADLVVTEYGVAHLRGIAVPERVRRMIAIAHPDDREALERQALEGVVGYPRKDRG